MMLRSHAKNTDNGAVLAVDPRHKRKQDDQIGYAKNPMEPAPKKSTSKGLTELRAHISGFLIDSAKRESSISAKDIKRGKENIRPETTEDVKPDPCPNYDFDKDEHSPESVSEFAKDIFKYYKSRENHFRINDYMKNHPDLDTKTRAILVDWLVEVQESFELNHETLYNAVKLIDMYLSKTKNVTKNTIQMLACAAVFIASKYDERSPPLADDLSYMAGDKFTKDELIEMERELFSKIDFDLGSPLSYRYLRRLGRVCKVDMNSLTLARYILETSLLVYDYSLVAGSRMAAAAFLLAMKMKNANYEWSAILEKYSGYTPQDVFPLMEHLNHTMHFVTNRWKQLSNIREKYSHEVFFSAALEPLLPDILANVNEIPPIPKMHYP